MYRLFLILILLSIALIPTANANRLNGKFAGIVVDVVNGKVLYQHNSHKIKHPASLTKLMTLYITFQNIQEGKLSWQQKLKVSKHAASQVPSKLGLKAGEFITVKTAVLSLIVKSANDSAVVLAEAIGKTEANFVKIMNATARKLNMHKTYFANASGLHHPKQVTTAYEIAVLGISIQKYFANYYPLFGRTHFMYKGKRINSFNEVLKKYPGADGLKTGYTGPSGFNLATSVKRDQKRILGVVMGLETAKIRNDLMVKLLNKSIKKSSSLNVIDQYSTHKNISSNIVLAEKILK